MDIFKAEKTGHFRKFTEKAFSSLQQSALPARCNPAGERSERCPSGAFAIRRKRGKRVTRGKQRAEASAIPAAPTEIAANDLLSRTVASQVPSALKSLTSVFGMEQGSEGSGDPVGHLP